MPESLLIQRDADVLTLILNRPARGNALDEPLVEALLEVFTNLDPATRLVVLRGAGRNFCTGFDLDDLDTVSDGDLLRRFVRIERLLQGVFHAAAPVLAFGHGRVMGAGADIFCAASQRLATPDATFQMPGWRFGIALGTRRLAQRIGNEQARAILLESRVLDAGTAVSCGLAQALVPADRVAETIAETLRAFGSLTQQAIADVHRLTRVDTREADMAALVETASRPGLKERIQSYRRKAKTQRS